jgi:hypothetical protein
MAITPVSEPDLRSATEMLSSNARIQPVTTLDGNPSATVPGPVWRKLYDAYQAYKLRSRGRHVNRDPARAADVSDNLPHEWSAGAANCAPHRRRRAPHVPIHV